MARITILVYSIQLVMIRKATLLPQALSYLMRGPPPLNCLVKLDGVVKALHLRRCCKISIIATYSSTPK